MPSRLWPWAERKDLDTLRKKLNALDIDTNQNLDAIRADSGAKLGTKAKVASAVSSVRCLCKPAASASVSPALALDSHPPQRPFAMKPLPHRPVSKALPKTHPIAEGSQESMGIEYEDQDDRSPPVPGVRIPDSAIFPRRSSKALLPEIQESQELEAGDSESVMLVQPSHMDGAGTEDHSWNGVEPEQRFQPRVAFQQPVKRPQSAVTSRDDWKTLPEGSPQKPRIGTLDDDQG